MTLLLTEVSGHGVVMVAESAVGSLGRTPYTHRASFRLAYGARKVIPVPRLHCGVGIWGVGAVETKEPYAYTPDVWVADFLEARQDLASIAECAEALKDELLKVLIHIPGSAVTL